ncbi:hypothetical protein TNCV_185641 [Trichonephila clavipes]|nr:hypothetical protein TNCV_185641 [Trichonephila clavipes]
MISKERISRIESKTVPMIQTFAAGAGMFQQDLVPCHTSKSVIFRNTWCNVVTSNGDRRLWGTRHSHVHLAAAGKRLRRGQPRNPFFEPRGVEPHRPDDG